MILLLMAVDSAYFFKYNMVGKYLSNIHELVSDCKQGKLIDQDTAYLPADEQYSTDWFVVRLTFIDEEGYGHTLEYNYCAVPEASRLPLCCLTVSEKFSRYGSRIVLWTVYGFDEPEEKLAISYYSSSVGKEQPVIMDVKLTETPFSSLEDLFRYLGVPKQKLWLNRP